MYCHDKDGSYALILGQIVGGKSLLRLYCQPLFSFLITSRCLELTTYPLLQTDRDGTVLVAETIPHGYLVNRRLNSMESIRFRLATDSEKVFSKTLKKSDYGEIQTI